MQPNISVVINTRNEEKNLPFALRSVAPWADEIVVVDMASDDETLSIASSFGARTFSIEPAGFVEPARTFAVAKATGEWVLVLDADEIVPQPLSQRLLAIAGDEAADVVMCHRRTFLLGSTLRGTGWSVRDEVHPRFFRKGWLEFQPELHSPPVPRADARIVDLAEAVSDPDLAIQHFNYLGFQDFVDRLNRYTSIEAREAHDRGERPSLRRGFIRATREFLWRYVKLRGYRDGWRGLYLSLLMGGYRLLINAKQHQLAEVGPEDRIEALYAAEAERLLAAYSRTAESVEP